MKAQVGFEELRVPAIIGVYPEERLGDQDLFVTVRVVLNIAQAVASDDLHHTLDYTVLAAVARDLGRRGFQLIETFAAEFLKTITEDPRVEAVSLKVRKPAALPESLGSLVELSWGREVA